MHVIYCNLLKCHVVITHCSVSKKKKKKKKYLIFLSDFGSFASCRPQVRKANVREKCVRNANIFPFSFPFISIVAKKMIFRMNFLLLCLEPCAENLF